MARFLISDQQVAWEQSCSRSVTSDVLWKLDVYRAALFLLHVSRSDCRIIHAASPSEGVAEQLTRAAGSICANLAEGYSRSTTTDRLRFFAYALGSTRESVVWYQGASDTLAHDLIEDRLQLLTRIRSLLLGLIRSLRAKRPRVDV